MPGRNRLKLRSSFAAAGLALALLSAHGAAAAATCSATDAQLGQAVRAVHDKQKNVGAQAAIWLDGRIVWSEGFGFADLEARRPVTRSTSFGIASIAKAITGLAYLKAEGAGLIDPEAPITRYVPELQVSGAEAITPRLLLFHHAGVPHWEGSAARTRLYAMHFDNVAELVPLWNGITLAFKPGSEFLYSSPGFNLLALAVQRATGVEFRAYVQREVLRPLGLASTRFDDPRKRPPGTAERYTWMHPILYYYLPAAERVPRWDYTHNFAGGNMLSTAEDLVRLGAALQAPGYLSQAELEKIATRPKLAGGDRTTSSSYGWSVSAPGAERLISMTGSNAGLQAGVFSYPERKLVVSLLANAWGIGSGSGEMVIDLPKRLAELCAPRAQPAPAS
jgi:CubicO group peptidase (beta-lactamase class C family)